MPAASRLSGGAEGAAIGRSAGKVPGVDRSRAQVSSARRSGRTAASAHPIPCGGRPGGARTDGERVDCCAGPGRRSSPVAVLVLVVGQQNRTMRSRRSRTQGRRTAAGQSRSRTAGSPLRPVSDPLAVSDAGAVEVTEHRPLGSRDQVPQEGIPMDGPGARAGLRSPRLASTSSQRSARNAKSSAVGPSAVARRRRIDRMGFHGREAVGRGQGMEPPDEVSQVSSRWLRPAVGDPLPQRGRVSLGTHRLVEIVHEANGREVSRPPATGPLE